VDQAEALDALEDVARDIYNAGYNDGNHRWGGDFHGHEYRSRIDTILTELLSTCRPDEYGRCINPSHRGHNSIEVGDWAVVALFDGGGGVIEWAANETQANEYAKEIAQCTLLRDVGVQEFPSR
jgi:hypothetical protein